MKQPKVVRNWWIEVVIDGRAVKLEGGPKSKDGGIEVRLYQRYKGEVSKVLDVAGYAKGEDLTLRVSSVGAQMHYVESKR